MPKLNDSVLMSLKYTSGGKSRVFFEFVDDAGRHANAQLVDHLSRHIKYRAMQKARYISEYQVYGDAKLLKNAFKKWGLTDVEYDNVIDNAVSTLGKYKVPTGYTKAKAV